MNNRTNGKKSPGWELMTAAEAAGYLRISRATLYRWASSPDFPKRINLSSRKKFFKRSELDAWVQTKLK